MSTPYIIISPWPLLCQKLSKSVKISESYDKNNFDSFLRHMCNTLKITCKSNKKLLIKLKILTELLRNFLIKFPQNFRSFQVFSPKSATCVILILS